MSDAVPQDPVATWWERTPMWVKVLAAVLATGTVPAGVAAMLPFETKEASKTAHDSLQLQIDAIQGNIQPEVLKALRAYDAEKAAGRRR